MARPTAGTKASIWVFTSAPTPTSSAGSAACAGENPLRNRRATDQNSAAATRYRAASLFTPAVMNPNVGWNAATSAPAVQASGLPGSNSRRNR